MARPDEKFHHVGDGLYKRGPKPGKDDGGGKERGPKPDKDDGGGKGKGGKQTAGSSKG